MRAELDQLGPDRRIEGRRARRAHRARGPAAGAGDSSARCSPTSAFRVRLDLAVGRTPFAVGGDQLVEVRNQLRDLRPRVTRQLRGCGKLGQLAEAVTRGGQVPLDGVGVDRLRRGRGCCAACACAAGSLGVGVVAGLAGRGAALSDDVLPGSPMQSKDDGVVSPQWTKDSPPLLRLPRSPLMDRRPLGVGEGDGVLPPIDAANAVRCVRTSCSLAFAASSTPGAALRAGLPDVPTGLGSVAPVVPSPPSSSVRNAIRRCEFGARTDLARGCGGRLAGRRRPLERGDVPLQLGNAALRRAGRDASGISFNAASALRRSSFAELCASAGLEEVVCEGVGLVCCAQLPTGIASSADAAIAVVQLAVERFIAWLLPEQMLKSSCRGIEQSKCHGELNERPLETQRANCQ